MKIAKVQGREILDACGLPTIECEITLEDGSYVNASVPTGISCGTQEAVQLRDGGTRLMGKGTLKAIDNIEMYIAPLLIGQEPNLVSMDFAMIEADGTTDKSKIGANAILATSIAILRAQATVEGMEPYEMIGYLCEYSSVTLPFAMFNCIGGGLHCKGNTMIQEIMVIPLGATNLRACVDAMMMVYQYLYRLLEKNFSYVSVTAQGAFTADFEDDAQAIEMLMEAISTVQKTTKVRFVLALDVAASHFYDRKSNKYNWNGKIVDSAELIDLYKRLCKQYPIFSIEDGLSEFDESGWKAMTEQLSETVQLLGDDIFASSPNNIAHGIENGMATGAVIKPGQIGTLTETLQAIKLCREYDMTCVLSGRACETNDTIIVDIAVGTSTGYIKAGGLNRGEHVAKYNELLRIEDNLMLSLLEL